MYCLGIRRVGGLGTLFYASDLMFLLSTLSFSAKQGYWLFPQILWLQIAAKPLQIATWLLLTARRHLKTPYRTAQLPTPYELLFS